jgi:hypothetical protein
MVENSFLDSAQKSSAQATCHSRESGNPYMQASGGKGMDSPVTPGNDIM